MATGGVHRIAYLAFWKKSRSHEIHTLHFGKKFDPWEPHVHILWENHIHGNFIILCILGRNLIHGNLTILCILGKDLIRGNLYALHSEKDLIRGNLNTLHFGEKRDPWENHSTLHFGKREDREAENSDVLDSSKEDISYSNKKINSREAPTKLDSKMKDLAVLVPLPSYWKESNLKNFEKGPESFEDLKSLEDNSEIGQAKSNKESRNKRYWAPFQGPKSIVYPHAWLASQIRRSVIPKSIDRHYRTGWLKRRKIL
ncbi:hypothetical protein TNCT_668011 [Trichonephila clavata]|uniref:Uncharacterized protein n=1 Tax=Trichonephila clavata TaxID=2740835 RepID=A0A8X6L6K7_TRICU|nr:hypothetical protein TNCT_668011 [Trichonephila clavata]